MTRPATKAERAALVVATDKAEADHDAQILLSATAMMMPDPPMVPVPVDVFGVDEITITTARAWIELWSVDPPEAPPKWIGLKPRRSKR